MRPVPRALSRLLLVLSVATAVAAGGVPASAADPPAPSPGRCRTSAAQLSPQYVARLDAEFRALESRIVAHNAEPHRFTPAQEAVHRAYDQRATALNAELARLRTRAQGTVPVPADLAANTCRPERTPPWGGMNDYSDGGRMDAMQHVFFRHAFTSRFTNVSNFLPTTRPEDVRRWVDQVLRNPATTFQHTSQSGTTALDSYKITGPVGTIVGTAKADVNGRRGPPVDHLEIYVRNGVIRTAYPVAGPGVAGEGGSR